VHAHIRPGLPGPDFVLFVVAEWWLDRAALRLPSHAPRSRAVQIRAAVGTGYPAPFAVLDFRLSRGADPIIVWREHAVAHGADSEADRDEQRDGPLHTRRGVPYASRLTAAAFRVHVKTLSAAG
jgi:hypothetical protein